MHLSYLPLLLADYSGYVVSIIKLKTFSRSNIIIGASSAGSGEESGSTEEGMLVLFLGILSRLL